MHRTAAPLAVVAGALAIPTAAAAGTLTFPATCFEEEKPIAFSGTGFTPDRRLDLRADGAPDYTASVYPDSDGSFTDGDFTPPPFGNFTPRPLTIMALDQVDPANNASVTIQAYKFGTNFPIKGRPTQLTTWRFAGWPAGKTVYGHFRHSNRKVGNYRFGVAAGECGTLVTRAKRIPFTFATTKAARRGGWYVQVDTKPSFSFNTRPEYDTSFSL